MTVPTGWRRKAILLFKSEKRLNAGNIVKTFNNKNIEEMKAVMITESTCDALALTHKPRTKDLTAHLGNLKHQFIDQSELCFYHATLVVLLRRGYKADSTFSDFESLWEAESDYLLEHLSLRWLISACDTFIDHSKSTTRAAILINAVTLVNTLRIYETKHFLHTSSGSQPLPLSQENIEALYCSDLPLYDGLTYFRIGSDDTLKNMRTRYERFIKIDSLAATILLSIFDRFQTNNSAFSTMRFLHKNENSQWWVD